MLKNTLKINITKSVYKYKNEQKYLYRNKIK